MMVDLAFGLNYSAHLMKKPASRMRNKPIYKFQILPMPNVLLKIWNWILEI
jgi:hypothetical protein